MKKKIITFAFLLITFSCTKISPADSFYKKILSISESFLDKPYSLGPLGEGKGIDPDPLYREDRFDCLTYVETVLAKTFSTKENVKSTMNKIRYKNGVVSFVSRNHFQNPDWLNNSAKFLNNASQQISKSVLNKDSSKSKIVLDRKNWFKKNYNVDVDIEPEVVFLDYISLSDFHNNIEKFTKFIDKPYIFMTVISDKTLNSR